MPGESFAFPELLPDGAGIEGQIFILQTSKVIRQFLTPDMIQVREPLTGRKFQYLLHPSAFGGKLPVQGFADARTGKKTCTSEQDFKSIGLAGGE
jgi:hypothetical protein